MRKSIFETNFEYDVKQHYFNKDKLDYSTSIEFLSKPINTIAEYKQWVKAWKIAYNNLSYVIRKHKDARKEYKYHDIDFQATNEHYLWRLNADACSLMNYRTENKERYPSLIKEDSLV